MERFNKGLQLVVVFSVTCLCLINTGSCTNTSAHYLAMDNNQQYINPQYRSDRHGREPRFISFETKDNNIELELSFTVPFLSVPVKRTMDSTMNMAQGIMQGLPMANLNVGALILTGAVVFGAVFTLPSLLKLFHIGTSDISGEESPPGEEYTTWARGLNTGRSEMLRILNQVEEALNANDIDTTSCTQRAVCWMVKNTSGKINSGNATSTDKIIDGVLSSEWLQTWISGTVVQDALSSGIRGEHCAAKYPNCRLSPSSLEKFAQKYIKEKKGNGV